MAIAQVNQGNGHKPEAEVTDLWGKVVIPRKILDTCAEKGWLISTAEIAEIIGLNSSAITSRGERFAHEVWLFERVRREGNCYIWRISRSG